MKKSLLLYIGIAALFLPLGYGVVSYGQWADEAFAHTAMFGRNIARAENKISGIFREVTAYNVGVREQTDDKPCIGAGGHNLCRLVEQGVKVCAANFVPLGTILHIEGFGEHIVLDRTHRRFSHRVDIAMNAREVRKAIKFGIQKRLVETK